MKGIKTFDDLAFTPYVIVKETYRIPLSIRELYSQAKQAKMQFDNGYGVSVVFGSIFYSNGINTYEVAVLKNREICYDTPITNGVIGHVTADEVSEIMRKVQELQNT